MDSVCKLFIVEDEYSIRHGIEQLINWSSYGFEIIGEACNGKDALIKIEYLQPHIVITDIRMPEMDGIVLTKLLHTRYPAIQILVLSGHSDYNYVRAAFQYGAMDYILKPMLNPQDLLATLQKAAARIPGMQLQQTTLSTPEATLASFLDGFSVQSAQLTAQPLFCGPCYLLFGMDVAHVFDQPQDLQRHCDLLLQACTKYLRDIPFVCTALQGKIVLALVSLTAKTEKQTKQKLAMIAQEINAYCGNAFFACSTLQLSLPAVKKTYQTTFSEALTQRFYHEGTCFLEADLSKTAEQADVFDKKSFLAFLQDGNLKAALTLLTQAVAKIVENRILPEIELKSLVQNSFYQILDYWEDRGMDFNELSRLKRDYIMRVSHAAFAAELQHVTAQIVREILQYDASMGISQLDEMLQFISAHYSEKLTLTDLARKFNFNYYYLSTYFTAKYSENFSDYLHHIRIDKAKLLLQNIDIPVAEVGGMVGYTDNSYFARVFKKQIGMTPSHYRQQKTKAART